MFKDCFSTHVFLLQKRRRLQFDEPDEGMTDLLEPATTHPTTAVEQSLVAEEAGLNPPSAWTMS